MRRKKGGHLTDRTRGMMKAGIGPVALGFATIMLALSVLPASIGAGSSAQKAAAQETDREGFRRGRALSVTECTGCHRAYRPNEYPPQDWPPIIKKMGARASLSESQIRDLESYFVSAAGLTNPK